ncbi:MAG: hypothetical protein V4579_03165 [Pseudomonadota bacterium]
MQHEALDQWQYVVAAYAIGLGGTIGLVMHSWLSMRKAEARRDNVRRGERPSG